MGLDRDEKLPYFSVVIPLYNRAHLIQRTLKSVLEQTCQDFEIVIVDDGSSDNPEPVIRELADDRIRYFRFPNEGGGGARNRGVDLARGTYVAFLDSDDLFLPKKLEQFKALLTGDPLLIGYSLMKVDRGVGRYWIRPTRGIRRDEDVGEYLFVSNEFIQTSTIVIPRELAAQVRFDPSLRKGQDLDYCLRLQRAGARFVMIEEPLVIWLDETEVGRTSRVTGYAEPTEWLERRKTLLSPKAVLGYRATVLAYYRAPSHPASVAKDLFLAWATAGVPSRVVVRQILRSYLPKATYRRLVNYFVRTIGSES